MREWSPLSRREKVDEWLYAGVQVVWVIDPQRRVVEVFQPGQPLQVLREGDVLSCEAIPFQVPSPSAGTPTLRIRPA
ncbi:MAG: Uma2 family endonuclease [Fimbriimonadales bacterium]|nr:Uma2 family endonuclease [Fimbriimonadales bacterium]